MQITITLEKNDRTAGPIILNMAFLPNQSAAIDWDDGSDADVWSSATLTPRHTYPSGNNTSMTFQVRVIGTANGLNGFSKSNGGSFYTLWVVAWLPSLTDLSSLFLNQTGDTRVPFLFPENVTNLADMCRGATQFGFYSGSDSVWISNTGKVTNMEGMFYGTTNFRSDISSWPLADGLTAKSIFAGGAANATNTARWPSFTVTKGGRAKTDTTYYTT